MPNESDADNLVMPADSSRVAEDLMCITCGYNLRGLDRTGGCPECGLSAQHTISSRQGMTKRDLATLAFRVIALWHLISEVADTAPGYFFSPINSFADMVSFLIWLSVIALLVLLWWKAPWLATKAVTHDGPVSVGEIWKSTDVMALVMTALGIVLMTWGVAGFAWSLAEWLRDEYRGWALSNMAGASISFIIGLVLVLGSEFIARLIVWLRTAGTGQRDPQ